MPRPARPAPPAAELQAAYATTATRALAARYRVSPATIRAWLRAAGIPVRAAARPLGSPAPGPAPQRLPEATRAGLVRKGLTLTPLVAATGLAEEVVSQALRGRRVPAGAARALAALL